MSEKSLFISKRPSLKKTDENILDSHEMNLVYAKLTCAVWTYEGLHV